MKFIHDTAVKDKIFSTDTDRYISRLRDMIACRTISEPYYKDETQFEKFDKIIRRNYKSLFAVAENIAIDGATFLRIPGNSAERPLVLMSHKDVVHEGNTKWKADPFSGQVIKGRMYGRGTFDTKGSLSCIFEALDSLIAEGKEFDTDIYILSTSTEETGGPDAQSAVDYFKEKRIIPGLVLDEGGAVLINPFRSGTPLFGMVGAVERSSGYALFDFDDPEKAERFTKAIKKLRPGKYDLYPEVKQLLEGLSDSLCKPLNPIVKALTNHPNTAIKILTHAGMEARSFCGALCSARKPKDSETERITEENGGNKPVYPIIVNFSGNNHVKIAEIEKAVLDTAKKFRIKPSAERTREAEPPISTYSDGFRFTELIGKKIFGDIKFLPYPVLGRTDARYFVGYAEDVIRFLPIKISLSQMMKFHAPNENIFVSSLAPAVAFYRELILSYKP